LTNNNTWIERAVSWLFRNKQHADNKQSDRKPWSVGPETGQLLLFMGWRVLTCQKGTEWLSLQIEPMAKGPCRVYVPSECVWRVKAPDWAKDQRDDILSRLTAIEWNRDVEWLESDHSSFWPRHVNNPIEGSLESTSGGRLLEQMGYFQQNSRTEIQKQVAKEVWCALAEKFALHLSGQVTIDESAPVIGSVFHEIELPALQRNAEVTLHFETGAFRN